MINPSRPFIGITPDYCPPGGYAAQTPWYALRENYIQVITEWGGIPLILPYHPQAIPDYLAICQGIVITGGHFDIDPQLYGVTAAPKTTTLKLNRTAFEWLLVDQALALKIPLFGICGGMQLLNVVRGGTLIQDIQTDNPQAMDHKQTTPFSTPGHTLEIVEGTYLAKLYAEKITAVNTDHHQAIGQLGRSLIVNAYSDDGVIEGIEDSTLPFCMGVQWHPEYQSGSLEPVLWQAFIKAAQAYSHRNG